MDSIFTNSHSTASAKRRRKMARRAALRKDPKNWILLVPDVSAFLTLLEDHVPIGPDFELMVQNVPMEQHLHKYNRRISEFMSDQAKLFGTQRFLVTKRHEIFSTLKANNSPDGIWSEYGHQLHKRFNRVQIFEQIKDGQYYIFAYVYDPFGDVPSALVIPEIKSVV